jgi:methyl-accepting chemotaxis protein
MVEYDLDGYIIFVNDAYLNLLDLKREEVIGKHHKYKIELSEREEKEYENFWKELIRGKTKKEINNFIVNEKNLWLLETYTPIRDEKGKVYKILKIALDITESKELEQQLQQHTEELKSQEEELRQNLEEVSTIQEEVTKKDKEFEKLSKELEIKNAKLKSTQEKLAEVQKMHKAKEQKMQEEINKLKNKS